MKLKVLIQRKEARVYDVVYLEKKYEARTLSETECSFLVNLGKPAPSSWELKGIEPRA